MGSVNEVRRCRDDVAEARVALSAAIAEWLPVGAVVRWSHGPYRREATVEETARGYWHTIFVRGRTGKRYGMDPLTILSSDPEVEVPHA